MKKLLCFALSSAALAAHAFVPEVGYEPHFLSLDSIVCTPQETRMSLTLTHLPHYWVKVDSTSVLTDEATGQTYKIIGQENLPLSQEIWMPESGSHSGTLIFEPLPAGVKSLSYGTPDEKPEYHFYGIRLDKERQPGAEQQGLTAADVLAWPAPAEKWEGFDAKKYAQLEFYKPGSTAVVRGRVANVLPGYTTTIYTRNYVADNDENTFVEFDSLGNFCVEVPIDYPQLGGMRIDRSYVSMMLTPGDTIEVYTTTSDRYNPDTRSLEPKYLRYGGSNPDAVAISCLLADVKNRLIDSKADFSWFYNKVNEGHDSVMAAASEIKADLPRIIAHAQEGIAEYPISPFAKDFLFTYAVLRNYMPIPDMDLYWGDKQYIQSQGEDGKMVMTPNPDYVPLNVIDYYGGQQAYQDLIYDNALVLCAEYIIINRSQFSDLFRWQALAIDGMEALPDFGSDLHELSFVGDNNPYPLIRRYEQQREQAIGLGDCIMQQFALAANLCLDFKAHTDYKDYAFERGTRRLSELMPLFTCGPLRAEVVKAYGSYAKEYGKKIGGSGSSAKVIDVESDVVAALIEPYAGRVVYIDVWNITCGPCRAGIIDQKPLLQKYADEPFTVIYLAPEESKDRCEAWLTENGIQGEHIYLSQNSYNRLSADFNIVGIPFGILINKKGEVVKEHLHSITLVTDLLESLITE